MTEETPFLASPSPLNSPTPFSFSVSTQETRTLLPTQSSPPPPYLLTHTHTYPRRRHSTMALKMNGDRGGDTSSDHLMERNRVVTPTQHRSAVSKDDLDLLSQPNSDDRPPLIKKASAVNAIVIGSGTKSKKRQPTVSTLDADFDDSHMTTHSTAQKRIDSNRRRSRSSSYSTPHDFKHFSPQHSGAAWGPLSGIPNVSSNKSGSGGSNARLGGVSAVADNIVTELSPSLSDLSDGDDKAKRKTYGDPSPPPLTIKNDTSGIGTVMDRDRDRDGGGVSGVGNSHLMMKVTDQSDYYSDSDNAVHKQPIIIRKSSQESPKLKSIGIGKKLKDAIESRRADKKEKKDKDRDRDRDRDKDRDSDRDKDDDRDRDAQKEFQDKKSPTGPLKSVLARMKEEPSKPPATTNYIDLPDNLKSILRKPEFEHAIPYILGFLSTLTAEKKNKVYSVLVSDVEFIPLICDRLLESRDPKQNESICEWMYQMFTESELSRLFAIQFIPCMVWCIFSRDPTLVSGIVAALLSLYKTEKNIHKYVLSTQIKNDYGKSGGMTRMTLLSSDEKNDAFELGIRNDHNLFPSFGMPDLDTPSVYHAPKAQNKSKSPLEAMKNYTNVTFPTHQQSVPTSALDDNDYYNSESTIANATTLSSAAAAFVRSEDLGTTMHNQMMAQSDNIYYFPTLNHANMATNLQLAYVSLQLFNHYISRMPKECLEQFCAVAAKLSGNGTDASDGLDFPPHLKKSVPWQWHIDDKPKSRHLLPSNVINQFLTGIRYALRNRNTYEMAQFALAQVHKRAHIDIIPEIILQTTSMLHTAYHT